MTKLLYIESSPRGKRSYSTNIANAFLERWRQNNPTGEVDHLSLWNEELPPYDQNMLDAKYAVLGGGEPAEGQVAAWARIQQIADRFKSADLYLFSVPMWNFSLPYTLKHYFDLLIQPGITFSFSPETGFAGLVTGKKAVLVFARGGAYSEGSGMEIYDYQTGFLQTMLGFIGITDTRSVVMEPTLGAPDVSDPALQNAQEEARTAADQL